jgi:hypothetical protein
MAPIEQKDGTTVAVMPGDFPLPVPARCRAFGKRKWQPAVIFGRRSARRKTIALLGFDDAARRGQGGQSLIEAGGADTAEPTQFRERQRAGGSGERCCDALVDGAGRRCLRCMPFDHLKRQRIGALREFERDGGYGGSCAMLSRESEIITIAAQVEIQTS